MTYDEMKKMLDEMKHKKSLLRAVQRQIQEAREQIDCLHAQDYGVIAVQGGIKEPAAERFVEHLERLEKRYESLMTEAFRLEDYISEHLSELSAVEQTIIVERYIHGKSWRSIERTVNYSERMVFNYRKSAIVKLSKRLQ